MLTMLFCRCESSAVADVMFRTHPGLIPSKSWQVCGWYRVCLSNGQSTMMTLAPERSKPFQKPRLLLRLDQHRQFNTFELRSLHEDAYGSFRSS